MSSSEKALTWRNGPVKFTVVRRRTVTVKAGRWDSTRHPRDGRGRFIRVGATVRIRGGGTGTVTGFGGRGVQVERDSDQTTRTYPPGYLTVIKTPEQPADPAQRPPLTDDEYEAHTREVERRMGEALAQGRETHLQHTANGDGVTYTPERAAQHKEIIDELMGRYANIPAEGRAVIAGGLGGAGKSTVLGKYAGIDQKRYATVNPDDIKELMAARGMVPEVEGLSPMEASPLIHEESSTIANLLARRLYAQNTNVIWDITMSRHASVDKRINELRAAGYTDIEAVFVDIPVETSVARALARHRRGMEAHRNGRGPGGRYVPPSIIRKAAGSGESSANRQVFDGLRDRFDRWALFDNSVTGREPVRLGGGHRGERNVTEGGDGDGR